MDGIPPEVAAVLRPVLPDLAAETIRAIGREVPDYSRPLEGRLGITVRYGMASLPPSALRTTILLLATTLSWPSPLN